ncbi:MAG: formylglycine-generating enzyme family protein [Planctomycetaceae bacterium]
MNGIEAGQVRDDNGLKMKLVWCPPGVVTMEQVDVIERVEKIVPVKVHVTRGFWLGRYEVTQAEWTQVMKTEPWKDEFHQHFTQQGPTCPATPIKWNDAMEFCVRLTEKERDAGRLSVHWQYTLPTEAQWELACRAGTETKFSFGDDSTSLTNHAWYRENSGGTTHPVGKKMPNPWGFYDMHGNVWEWCRDSYTPKLPGGKDPEVYSTNPPHVARGGGWTAQPKECQTAFREYFIFEHQPVSFKFGDGFRVALIPVRQEKQLPETR